MIDILIMIALILGSYMFGNINNAVIISKIKKQDVRKMGSGNPGSMNMFRNYGFFIGVLTMLLDIAKGALPCILGWYLLGDKYSFSDNKFGVYLCGLSVIVGHIYPVIFGFKGGKGIASSIGVCFVVNPLVALISFIVGALFIIVTQIGSITSFIMIGITFIIEGFAIAQTNDIASQCLLFALFFLTLFAHRKNVIKLFTGKESKTRIIKGKKEVIQTSDKEAKIV